MHLQFDDIYDRLDQALTNACSSGDVRRMGGVVGLMARMCVDVILRDKLAIRGEQQ